MLHLGFDLVALGHGHLPHVVAEAGDPGALGVVPGRRGPGPDAQLRLDLLILPVPDDDLAIATHAGADEPELAVAVGALVEVHEVHVDVGPGDVAVELRVQVHERLAQGAQPGDPHLGRGEGVHPGDQPDAVGGGVGLHANLVDRLRRRHDRLEDDLDRDLPGAGQGLGDLPGVLIDLLEGLGPVEVLTSSHKPYFELLQVDVHSVLRLRVQSSLRRDSV